MGQVNQAGVVSGWKRVTRMVTDDQSVLAYVKWNPVPENIYTTTSGTTVATAARMQVQANLVNFDINTVADADIGTYSGNTGSDDQVVLADSATVGQLIAYINGIELSIIRYRAGLGDFRPGFVIGTGDALAAALTTIMRGKYGADGKVDKGLNILADSSGLATANLFAAALGTEGAAAGASQSIPDHFETGYTTTASTAVTVRVREAARSKEEYPNTARFRTRLTSVHFGAAYATNAKTIDIYDQNNNLLYREVIGSGNALAAATTYDFSNPIVDVEGPVFVEAYGTGALTDGPLTLSGYTRVI